MLIRKLHTLGNSPRAHAYCTAHEHSTHESLTLSTTAATTVGRELYIINIGLTSLFSFSTKEKARKHSEFWTDFFDVEN